MTIDRPIQPRVIRLRDAATFLGMDRNRFNAEVRPYVTEFPVGSHGVRFDRLDLDAWLEDYISRNGRPGKSEKKESWGRKSPQDSLSAVKRGTSKKSSEVSAFERAVEQAISGKQNDT